jgi:hypothetical protein
VKTGCRMGFCAVYPDRSFTVVSDVLAASIIRAMSKPRALVNFYQTTRHSGEPGSLVSTVSDYGLDGRGSIPDRGRGFFL